MSWYYVGVFVASVVVSYLLAPKPPNAKPQSLTDDSLPIAKDGQPIPVVFGRVKITGPNILWYGDLAYRAVKTKTGK